MQRVRLAREGMATRFEFILVGEDERRLRAAGEEALDELGRVEAQLSLYRPSSEISQINRRAADEAVLVSPEVFQLLQGAQRLNQVTGGAFDITIAPLVRCWGFMKGSGARPADHEIEQARGLVGMHMVELDESNRTVRFARPGMMLDLGSLGKGYGLDSAVDILRENGIQSALLHGGTSTICAIGDDPENGPWKVVIEKPGPVQPAQPSRLPSSPSKPADPTRATLPDPPPAPEVLAVVPLRDESLSVSAVWGKHFVIDGEMYGHVLDPRTGWPARDAILGAVRLPSAAISDALSTAVLLGGPGVLEGMKNAVPGFNCLRLSRQGSGRDLETFGFELP